MSNCIDPSEHQARALVQIKTNRESYDLFVGMINDTRKSLNNKIMTSPDLVEIHRLQGKLQLLSEMLQTFDSAVQVVINYNKRK